MLRTHPPSPELYELRLVANCSIDLVFLFLAVVCFTYQGIGPLVFGCAIGWFAVMIRVAMTRRKRDRDD